MDTIADRVKFIIESKGLKQEDVAKQSGTTQVTISNILRGETKNPRNIVPLAKALGVSVEWLQNGEGHPSTNNLAVINYQDDEHTHKIDLLDVKAIAGLAGYVNPDYPDIITSIWLSDDGVLEILGRKTTRGINLINVPTDSMASTINKGDIVFIDSTIDCYVGEGIYFFELDGECFIKRLQKIPNGIVRALSDNKLYSSFDITAEQFSSAKVLGKFVKVLHITPQDL